MKQIKRTKFSVFSLTENTQRYKSPRGSAIFPLGAIFACGKRYALRGVVGFISYRIGAKRQYIARAKRVYRVCLQTYRLKGKNPPGDLRYSLWERYLPVASDMPCGALWDLYHIALARSDNISHEQSEYIAFACKHIA